jgi:hypothetical protein
VVSDVMEDVFSIIKAAVMKKTDFWNVRPCSLVDTDISEGKNKRPHISVGRSQWPRGLRRRSEADRLLGSWVPIPPVAWMFGSCECCVLSGRDLCDVPIPRPEESYRLWCVCVCLSDQVKIISTPALSR